MKKYIHYCWFGPKPLPKLAKKCIKSWQKYLPDFEIKKWDESNVNLDECPFIREAYDNKKWAFVADYVRAKVLKEYGGIYFDTDMEVTKNIDCLFNDKTSTFLGIEDTGYVAVGVWYEKETNSYLASELLKKYKSFEHFPIDDLVEYAIPKLISLLLIPLGFKFNGKNVQFLDNNIVIYPRDYFYPYSYDWKNNLFSDNTCMIHYYDASWISLRSRIENFFIRHFGKKWGLRFLKFLSYIKKFIKILLSPILLIKKLKNRIKNSKYEKQKLDSTINIINEYKKETIVFYNPEWKGVSSSTKELFGDIVKLPEIYYKKNIKKISKAIVNSNIKQVVFSSFAIGWKQFSEEIKKYRKDIKINAFWHGSISQVLDEYGWKRNEEIIELYRNGIINKIGTCKKSLVNYYKSKKIDVCFITNTVNFDEISLEKKKNDKIKIGIYAAKCSDWRKNIYTQIAAVSLIENAVLDIVPFDNEVSKILNMFNIKATGEKNQLSRDELIKRMAKNDVNLYVTFSECAPMLPLESFEVDVPCITGNNHHYFTDSKLNEYVVVSCESSVQEIKDKILYALNNKKRIMDEYKNFKVQNNNDRKIQIKEFLGDN